MVRCAEVMLSAIVEQKRLLQPTLSPTEGDKGGAPARSI
jgi:hypothetical protein